MRKNVLKEKVENNGLILISAAVALIFWQIDKLQLGPLATRVITTFLFISYGIFSQYIINTNKRFAAKALSLSITDPLTGLYNRRGFMTLAEQQLKIEKRKNENLLLIYADIDDLKSVNDNFGHAKGDALIVHVAAVFKKIFRESDIIARIGGDEFVVLALGAAESSDTLEKRLHQQFDAHNDDENQDCKVSISFGVVYLESDDSHSIDELMSKADRLMYEQKNQKQLNLSE